MSEVTLNLDLGPFNRAMDRYITDLKWEAPKAVKRQAKGLLNEILELTPPHTKAEGVGAVRRDFGRAITLIDPDKLKKGASASHAKRGLNWGQINSELDLVSRLEKAVSQHDTDALKAILQNLGFGNNVRILAGNADYLIGAHDKQQNSQGRVRSKSALFTADKREYQEAQKKLEDRVGWALSGWSKSAKFLGIAIPWWIATHQGKPSGMIDMLDSKDFPRIRMENYGVFIPGYSGLIQKAVEYRVGRMDREVEHLLDKAAKKAGFQTG